MLKATFAVRRNTTAGGTVKGHIRGGIKHMAIKLLTRESTDEATQMSPE